MNEQCCARGLVAVSADADVMSQVARGAVWTAVLLVGTADSIRERTATILWLLSAVTTADAARHPVGTRVLATRTNQVDIRWLLLLIRLHDRRQKRQTRKSLTVETNASSGLSVASHAARTTVPQVAAAHGVRNRTTSVHAATRRTARVTVVTDGRVVRTLDVVRNNDAVFRLDRLCFLVKWKSSTDTRDALAARHVAARARRTAMQEIVAADAVAQRTAVVTDERNGTAGRRGRIAGTRRVIVASHGAIVAFLKGRHRVKRKYLVRRHRQLPGTVGRQLRTESTIGVAPKARRTAVMSIGTARAVHVRTADVNAVTRRDVASRRPVGA